MFIRIFFYILSGVSFILLSIALYHYLAVPGKEPLWSVVGPIALLVCFMAFLMARRDADT